jgi:hypothetical protein
MKGDADSSSDDHKKNFIRKLQMKLKLKRCEYKTLGKEINN